jgi:two-component system chemotaxis response regulator CheB
MLTGMGTDGAIGMKEMKDAGVTNIIQDEASSVVWGMPGEAFKLGAVDYVVTLDEIAEKMLSFVR